MPMGGGGDGGLAKTEAARQGRINAGMSAIDNAFSGFNENFFNTRRNDYINYALPQLTKQYQNTRNNLAYSLARNGLTNSGAAVKENQALTDTNAENVATIGNEAQNQANQTRQQVATQKANVTNQLISSGDPSLARESAQQATAGLNAPPSWAPIGNLFSDFTNTYINNQTAKAYSNNQPSIFSQLGSVFGGGGSRAFVGG